MVYPVGTLAFYDSFQGLIPCKITEIIPGRVRAVVTEAAGAYAKGDTIDGSSVWFPPKNHIKQGEFSTTIIGGYEYK